MLRMLTALLCTAVLMTAAETVTIAFEDGPQQPWTMPDGTGVDIQLLNMVGAKIGVEFKLTSMPWKRCLSQMQEDKIDGVLNASFKEERLAMGCYPTGADGKVDPARKTHDNAYALYRIKGSDLGWDGKVLSNLSGKIGAQSGFSIIDQLKELKAQVDDETKDLSAVMKKLASGRLQGAALHIAGGDAWLAANPEVAAKIERVDPPLVVKPYYLMLSKAFVAKRPELAKAIWDGIAAARETAEYKKLLAGN